MPTKTKQKTNGAKKQIASVTIPAMEKKHMVMFSTLVEVCTVHAMNTNTFTL